MTANRELAFRGEDVSPKQIAALEENQELEQLTISGGSLTSDQLAPLRGLTKLKGLVLREMPIDDGLLPHLKSLQSLEYLNLSSTNVEGNFAILSGLPLRDVRLGSCARVGDKCAASLAAFKTLRQVEIHKTGLTDAGLKALARSPLEVLWLGPHITDEGVRSVATMKQLQHLDISAPGVTDAGIRFLAELRELETLWLTGCGITDASVSTLSQMKSLRELNVTETGITENGTTRLRRALGNCQLSD